MRVYQHRYIAGRRGRLVVADEFRLIADVVYVAVTELTVVAGSPAAERP